MRLPGSPPTAILLVFMDVDDGLLELPRRDFALEQDIRLTVRAVLQLRKEEVSHHPAYARSTSPDVAALSREIPPCGVEHLRGKVDHGDLGNVVRSTTNAGAQRAKTNGRRFGDDGVRDGSERTGINDGDDDAQTGLGEIGMICLVHGGNDGEDEQECDIDSCTPEVDAPTTEPGGEEPGYCVCDELKTASD